MRIPLDRYIKRGLFHLYAPRGWARMPNHVTLDITRRCNLRCQMCFYYGGEQRSVHEVGELRAEQIINHVINRLNGVDYDITGGEPFARTDILEILGAIKKRRAGCFIVTNGTLITRDMADRIVGDELLNLVSYSVHGAEKEHDAITRVPGSFQRSLRGIDFIHEARERRNSKKPGTAIACTVNRHNMDNIDDLLQLKQLTGVNSISLGCCSFIPTSIKQKHEEILSLHGLACNESYDDLVTGPPEVNASSAQVGELVSTLKRRRAAGETINTSPQGYSYDDISSHFLDKNWVYKKSCTYPWRNLRVLPDGSVVPCIGYLIGNVAQEDVVKLWNNDRFRKFRSVLYKRKLFPGCFRCCKLK